MFSLIQVYIQIFFCDNGEGSMGEIELVRNCNAFYYPFLCLLTIIMIILVICLAMLFVCTSFENFFKEDVLTRIPTTIDYNLIWLRIFLIVSD